MLPASDVPHAQVLVPPAQEDDGSEIDVFVFYTPAARAVLNGTRRARAQIDLAVAETNAAYKASDAAQRIRLVGAVEIPYEEPERANTDNPDEELVRFQRVGDGHMDEVHLIRDAYAADLVHLLTDRGRGVAYVSPYDDTRAFAQTEVSFGRVSPLVFAHELGHNMGLRHDRYELLGTDLNWPSPYSHGYVNQAAFADGAPFYSCFFTIMAYFNQCADAGRWGPKLMRFSNPNQYYPDTDGDPMGIPGDDPSEQVDGPADAVRSLNETRTSVANFRASANRCSYRLARADDARIVVGVDGGSFTVGVEVGEGCPAEAVSHDEFVEVVTSPTHEGVDLAFQVAGNEGGARIGLITVMGASVEILQKGRTMILDVCGRSPWMRDALTEYAGRESCDEVTDFDLAEVYELRLFTRGITGSIGRNDFEDLVNLRLLDLRSNKLSGPIPAEVGRLRELRRLFLERNELSGPIPPELGDLENLSGSLVLDDNRLSGPIPEELGNLRNAWGISLARNALTGDIPPAIGSMDHLRKLRLQHNDLSGPVPPELGQMENLIELRLHDNDLSGPIPPELGQLEHIIKLSLHDNALSSPVPPELGQLENLLELSLRGNALTGCVPVGLRDVPDNDLDQLGLGYCATVSLAHGGPPDAPGEAGRVTEGTAASITILAEPEQDAAFDVTVTVSGGEAFGVARGDRTVTIPSGMTEATLTVDTENDEVEEPDGAFTAMIVADTGFALMTSRSSASIIIDDDEGPSAPTIVSLIPEDGMLTVIWSAPPGDGAPITEYHIRYRPAPPASEWQTWTRISHETGALQRDIRGLNDRVEYDVQVRAVNEDGDGAWSETARGTPRSCPDGVDLGDCRTLRAVRDILVGSGTALNWATGLPIEEWTGVAVNRRTGRVAGIRLSGQDLSGAIPAELGNLTELTSLSLTDNELTGIIPPQLGNLTRLLVLRLSNNRLTGIVPVELSELSNLSSLSISHNEFTGTVPPELGRLVNLEWLLLGENGLTGSIPPELGGLTNLVGLWLQGNDLTGPIPAELANLTNLGLLWLHGNELTGPIPAGLGRLSKLRQLLLYRNRLTGTIPRSLANLTNLNRLLLADNDLTGCVPASLRDVPRNDLDQLDLPDCPPPSVIDLVIESIPLDGRAYGAGERIEASVWFEPDVTVSGSPQLALSIGSGSRAATFVANHGNGRLAFRYTVEPADRDSDGISIAPNALTLNGGKIRDAGGEHAVLDLGEHSIANHPSHQVRGALRELVPDQELEAGGEALTLDLSRYFNFPEGGTLTYGTPISSNPAVVTAIIEDGLLKIMPQEEGIATITVTATDDSGVTVTLSFRVAVTATMRGLRPWLMGVLAEEQEAEEGEANDPQ